MMANTKGFGFVTHYRMRCFPVACKITTLSSGLSFHFMVSTKWRKFSSRILLVLCELNHSFLHVLGEFQNLGTNGILDPSKKKKSLNHKHNVSNLMFLILFERITPFFSGFPHFPPLKEDSQALCNVTFLYTLGDILSLLSKKARPFSRIES